MVGQGFKEIVVSRGEVGEKETTEPALGYLRREECSGWMEQPLQAFGVCPENCRKASAMAWREKESPRRGVAEGPALVMSECRAEARRDLACV